MQDGLDAVEPDIRSFRAKENIDMKKINITITLGLVGLVFLASCSGTSHVMPTGTVKDILIKDEISPNHLRVRAGDQVRWINQRMRDARVEFNKTVSGQFFCNQGFRVMAGIGHDSAVLAPGQSASLCFTEVGTRHYVVRTDTSASSEEGSLTGTVTVE